MEVFEKSYHPPGTSPGTLQIGEQRAGARVQLRLAHYTPGAIILREQISVADCAARVAPGSVTWLNITGSPDATLLGELGEAFGLHRLALEDVANLGQRPKAESYDDSLFAIVRWPQRIDSGFRSTQISLFLGEHFLISFCSASQHPFSPIYDRLRKNGSSMRERGADYLFYTLVDTVIDEGFPVLEDLGEQVEALENELLEAPTRGTLERIHQTRRNLLLLRRALWPQREVVNSLLRNDSRRIAPETVIYFRDCYDHSVQIIDLLETYREVMAGMLDIYLSSISNRMNEVMRLLTVIATIFIPLTFIVGVYGMNFDRRASPWNMPELGWHYGYPLVWGIMIAIAVGMLILFKRKHWF